MARWWVVGLAVLSACGPESLDIDAYCQAIGEAECVRYQRCGYLTEAVDCSKRKSFDCLAHFRPQLNTAQLHYDPVTAFECVKATREDNTCDFAPKCRDVVVGNSNEGEACGTCAAGLVCIRRSEDTCGTCEPFPTWSRAKIGEACFGVGLGLDGFGDTGPLGGLLGAPCESNALCANDVCVAANTLGEACSLNSCVSPLACIEGVCVERGEVGEACSDVAVCKGGLNCVDALCTLPGARGASCTQRTDCASLMCIDGQCSDGQALGRECNSEKLCGRDLLCENGTCRALPKAGEKCEHQCADGKVCLNSICQNLLKTVCR